MTTDNHSDDICPEAPLKSETLVRAECGDFIGIDLEWYHSPRSEWPRLLELLKKAVGKIPISHGLETADRYMAPNEFDDVHLRDASEALRLGELEAAVEGDPPLASDAWRTLLAQVYAELDNFKASPDLIEGDQELSEKAYAKAAASHLKNISFVTALANEQTADTDYQHTLTEIIAEVAYSAFLAGQHTRAALGKAVEVMAVKSMQEVKVLDSKVKSMEPDANRGAKILKGSSEGGIQKGISSQETTGKILKTMDSYQKVEGYGIGRSAAKTYKDRHLGTSASANEQLWRRWKRKGRIEKTPDITGQCPKVIA